MGGGGIGFQVYNTVQACVQYCTYVQCLLILYYSSIYIACKRTLFMSVDRGVEVEGGREP